MSTANNVSFYWYSDVNDVMFRAIQDVKSDPNRGKDIIAHVLYLQNLQNRIQKIAIVYMYRSDIHNINGLPSQERQRIKNVLKVNYNNFQVVGESTITKQEIFDGDILEVGPLNNFYRNLPFNERKFTKFRNFASFQDCESKECIADYNKCDEQKYIYQDNIKNFPTKKQLPYTYLFCREKTVDDMTAELDMITDFTEFKAKVAYYFKMPNFFSKIEEAVKNGNELTKKQFYMLKDIPEFKEASVTDEEVLSSITTEIAEYLEDDEDSSVVSTFFDLMKVHRYTIAGGFVLKHVLKQKPGFQEKYWQENDIDIWAMRNKEDDFFDPFDPLKKLLLNAGFTVKKLCGAQLLKDFDGDYRRLVMYVENIQEWTKTIQGKDYKIQLILLKDKDAHLKNIMKRAQRMFENNLINHVDDYYIKKSLKYHFRSYDDYICDVILSFDLTCCQGAFSVDDEGNKKITFLRNTLDLMGEDIMESIYNYRMAFSDQCIRLQTIWEWLRTELRAIKYSLRGYKITNWDQVISVFDHLFEIEEIDINFVNYWNNSIGRNILNKSVEEFPIIHIIDDVDELGTFTLRDRQYNVVIYGEAVENRSTAPVLVPDLYPQLQNLLDLGDDEINMEDIADVMNFDLEDPDFDFSSVSYPTKKEDDVFDESYKFQEEVDEQELLKDDAECFDSLTTENSNNLKFLNEDEDNIIFVRKIGVNNFQSECLNRKLFYKILNDPNKGFYPCLAFNSQTNRPNSEASFVMRGWYNPDDCYYRVDTGFGSYCYSEEDLRKIIKSRVQIFFVVIDRTYEKSVGKSVVVNEELMFSQQDYDPEYLVSAYHCNVGSAITTTKIKICMDASGCAVRDINGKLTENRQSIQPIQVEEKEREEKEDDTDEMVPLSQLRRRIDFNQVADSDTESSEEEKENVLSSTRRRIDFNQVADSSDSDEEKENIPPVTRRSMRNVTLRPRGSERHPRGIRRQSRRRRSPLTQINNNDSTDEEE